MLQRLQPAMALRVDRFFLACVFGLVVFGLIMLMSASGPVGYAKFNDVYFFVKRQLLFGIIPGAIACLFIMRMRPEWFRRVCWIAYGLSIVMLISVFLPGIGSTINGSRSWIHVGSYNFQPAEFAKIALILFLSYQLTAKKYDWNDWQTSILPILSCIAPIFALVLLQPDVGTASILAVIVFALLYIARVPGKYLSLLALVGVLGFIGLIIVAPYRAQRLTTFLHPELDPKGVGYQMNQAFLAVGSGGVWGLGFGNSRQKFQYLPEVDADSIFAIIAEENGFAVSLLLIILIFAITLRGLKIAKGAPDEFSRLLVAGIMVWFAWQSFLNIGAMVGALPLTGVPLLFVSHGGSAMITALVAVGVVANISKYSAIAVRN